MSWIYTVCFIGGLAFGLAYGADNIWGVVQWLKRKFLCAVSKKACLYYTQLDIDDKLDNERHRAAMRRAWKCILKSEKVCEEEDK